MQKLQVYIGVAIQLRSAVYNAVHFGIGTFTLKVGLAQMLKGGIIMDVTDAAQAKIAEEAGVRQ